MKYLSVILSLGLLACVQHPSPVILLPKQPPASMRDCEQLYAHNLMLVIITQLDPDRDYDALHMKVATEMIDQSFRDSGATDRFYAFCTHKMTVEQVACGMKANSTQEVSLCSMP